MSARLPDPDEPSEPPPPASVEPAPPAEPPTSAEDPAGAEPAPAEVAEAAQEGWEPPPAAGEAAGGDGGDADLRKRALGGTFWTVLGYGVQNVLRLGGNLVLTRLLFPEAFGLMAIINTFLQGLQLFSDLGVAPCIVQSKRGDDEDFLNTAWTIQAVRGVLLYLACLVLMYPVVAFYESSEPLAAMLFFFLPVSGLRAVFSGLSSTRIHQYKRHLALRGVTLLDIGVQVIGLVTMVVWAAISPSIWALVVGGAVESFMRMALSHTALSGVRNRLRWDRDAAWQIFHFGKWIFVSTLVAFLAQQSDRLIFGKLVPWKVLGIYGIAATLYLLPIGVLLKLSHTVIFPVLSRLREQGRDWVPALHEARRPLVLVSGAGIACALPAAPALIEVLYDERYAGAGWMLQILLVGAAFRVLESPNVSVLLAVGRTGWIAVGHVARLVGLLVLLPIGYWQAGFPGALWGLVGADVLKYAVAITVVRRWGVRVLLGDLGLGLLVAASVLLGLGADHVLSGTSPVLRLAATVASASVVWVIPLWWWARDRRSQMRSLIVERSPRARRWLGLLYLVALTIASVALALAVYRALPPDTAAALRWATVVVTGLAPWVASLALGWWITREP